LQLSPEAELMVSPIVDHDEIAAAAHTSAAAYVLDPDEACQYPATVYTFVDDPDALLELPPDDLIFVMPDVSKEDAIAAIQEKHPPSHPALKNVKTSRKNSWDHPQPPRTVEVVDEWYDGRDANVVCEIARRTGEPVRVTQDHHWFNNRYHGKSRRYISDQTPLHDHECYLRKDGQRYFIVYDPKVVARRRKKWDAECSGDCPRSTPYVTCQEFNEWTKAMHTLNCAAVPTDIVGDANWEWRRYPVMSALRRELALFELLYGNEAFWQLDEFRALVKTWKTKGQATWRAFERSLHRPTFTSVFTILDKATSRKRKPRKRTLKARLPKGYRWK
jgi:hypothetical protein